MAERKSFLLRIDAAVLEAAQRWANDDLRSLNAQIEFVLREALKRAGRSPRPPGHAEAVASPPVSPTPGTPADPSGAGPPGPGVPDGPERED
jgi:hypothetical protein